MTQASTPGYLDGLLDVLRIYNSDVTAITARYLFMINGRRIQTAVEGQRLELDGYTNKLNFYDDNNVKQVVIGDNVLSSPFGGGYGGVLVQEDGLIIVKDENNSAYTIKSQIGKFSTVPTGESGN